MIKVGYMDYANVHPIFYFLLKNKSLSFIHGFPSELNERMRNGEVDISPASSIEFAKNPELYNILSTTAISSVGKVKSVCLFSNFSLEALEGKEILLTNQSNTSIILLDIILKKFYNLNCTYRKKGQGASAEFAAELLIGDDALNMYYHGNAPYIIDLGEEWFKKTNLPFVFALWLISKKVASTQEMGSLLREVEAHAFNEAKNGSHIGDKYLKVYSVQELTDYWQTIDYSFTEEHRKGLLLFYKYAYELGHTTLSPIIAEEMLSNALI